MEEPTLENVKSEEEEPDSALGNSQSAKSEDSGSISINVTSQGESELTYDCSAFSSVSDHKVDLFEQLVSHFEKKNNPGFSEERGRRPVRRSTGSEKFCSFRRRTCSGHHIVARRRQTNSATRRLISPSVTRNQKGTVGRRQTSTPESSSSNFDRTSSSDLGLSQIRVSSTSSSEYPNYDKQKNRIRSKSSNAQIRYSRTKQYCFSAIPPHLTLGRNSSSLQELEDIYEARKSPSVSNMLHSHTRRSLTPDITSQRQARRSEFTSPSLNGFLSPSGSRGSLDRMTADSIDRRRVRRRASDKFNDTIQGIGQLALQPARARSALGNITRDSDNWSTSSVHGSDVSSNPKNSSVNELYKDKNGRIKQSHGSPSPSVSSVLDHSPLPDLSINSVDSKSEVSGVHSRRSSTVKDSSAEEKSKSSLLDSGDFSSLHNEHARPQSELDVALSEDHDSIMRLARIREDQFTMRLISAMKELKDIAEVARIIDEVDNEEWLLDFIAELEHRLRYLMKLEEEDDEGPEDHEANLRERATILDVALDLISFLKDRSAYRDHRRSTFYADIDGTPRQNGSDLDIEDGTATIQRMKKLAETTPHNPYEMQKWQRQLSNLAGTLDKYIHVLQKSKEAPRAAPRNDVTQRYLANLADTEEDKNATAYIKALSQFSRPDKRDGRQWGNDRQKPIDSSVKSTENPKKSNMTKNANVNFNNNNSNQQCQRSVPVKQSRTLPVLDLRDTGEDDHVLDHIGQAAHVQGGRDNIFSPSGIDGENSVDWRPLHCQPGTPNSQFQRLHPTSQRRGRNGLRSSENEVSQSTSPGTAVVSAYCRFPESRRRAASLSNDRDMRRNEARQKSEFRMSVDSNDDHPEDSNEVAPARRTVSIDIHRNDVSSPPQQRNLSSGARPKIRSSAQSSSRKSTATYSESSSNSDLERPRVRHRPVTSSASTQCDMDQGLKLREKSAEDKLKQLKRRADLLKTGLEEVRQERDERERKIAVLQARLDRMKKNLVVGESEKGAVEEEMDRLNKLLKEKTIESAEEMAALKKRLEELERKLEKERVKYGKMNEKVEHLQQQLYAAQRQCDQMAGGKKELEQQIHDLTLALMHERKNAAHLQEENTRLENDLEIANQRLKEDEQENENVRQRLQELSSDLDEKLVQQRHLLDSASNEREAAQIKVSGLENELENAESRIGGLERENQKLHDEVEYLNHELKINQEMKETQKEQYDKEISRMLSEGAIQSGLDSTQLSESRVEAIREKERVERLRAENEQLKNELGEANASQNATKSTGTSTEDKSVQAEDMSYTRMRAFDWYSSQAHRDALRLNEQGRQLEMETRERLRAARDAMRQVNYTIIKRGSATRPEMMQPTRFGYQLKR